MKLTSEQTVSISMTSNRIVVSKDYCYFRSDSQKKKEILELNRKQAYNGFMSDATQRHVTKILSTWHEAINVYNDLHVNDKSESKRMITVITLTLSDDQKHDDKFIKRYMLDRYLVVLKRYYDVKYFFWKAEKQANGRIHFHLMVDSYIDMAIIQEEWNKIQREHGYTENYEKKYKKSEPPSTHVECIKNDHRAIRYMMKYLQKAQKESEALDLKVSGRIWGCSTELKNLKPYSIAEDSQLIEKLDLCVDGETVKMVEEDFFIIYFLDVKLFLRQFCPRGMSEYNAYYSSMYRELYINAKSLTINHLAPDRPKPKKQVIYKQGSIDFEFKGYAYRDH